MGKLLTKAVGKVLTKQVGKVLDIYMIGHDHEDVGPTASNDGILLLRPLG